MKQKMVLYGIGIFIVGLLVGGLYVDRFGSPIHLKGQNSSANVQYTCAQLLWYIDHTSGPAQHSWTTIYNSQCSHDVFPVSPSISE